MDAELKAKWVDALRSGKFRQGDAMLYNMSQNSFCCLGVLCKVMGAEFGSVVELVDDKKYARSYDFVPHIGDKVLSNGEDEELKENICKELGIPDQFKLIQMNDGNTEHGIKQHSFAEIADFIEKSL